MTQQQLETAIDRSVFKQPVSSLIGKRGEKQLWKFDEKEDINKIAEYFSNGLHRALITREGKKNCFLSQSDLTKHLCAALSEEKDPNILTPITQSLATLGHIKQGRSVVSVKLSETALTGFRRLLNWRSFKDWNLASLPIIDDKNGSVVGNLSESDLRGMTKDLLGTLTLPVGEYLEKLHGKKMRQAVTVTADTTFSAALDKVVKEKVHRAWIVDAKGNPIGTFSLSDVISQFTNFAWSHLEAFDDLFE
eukprot:CAMPEP_0197522688 /NCGR_PEP_ID=MMETSP1318-20131121/7786_1 /TAXON_ID=552666 /ORGANISM="Partenskyella glossopodia, Strain RCC365" /LENGTH=248 /DNA_ID=CAMNT_0043075139 /DNA_START=256 /DNA_END=1002 /DNA_ORIENTATION=-